MSGWHMYRSNNSSHSYREEDEDDGADFEESADAGNVVVPAGSTRRARVKDRMGKTSMRETTVLKFRACIHCNLVLSEEQFMVNGCLNCVDLELDNNREAIWANTTSNFRGLAVILKPEISWVAKYNYLGGAVGAYAVSVNTGASQY